MRFGDVVLTRRSWTVHPDALPAAAEPGREAAWLLSWQRWRRDHGVPRRVFASLDAAPIDPDVTGDGGVTMKPQYLDFDSVFSIGLFEAAVRGGNHRVVLHEMVPDTDDLWLRSAEGRHVAELTVEITGRTR